MRKEEKKILLRAGFEPATYGFLQCSANYSPPLYQLSYRRMTRMRGTQSSFYKPRATTELMSCDPLSNITTFPWCSGYHIRLTRGRSPVRARAETIIIPCGLVARIAGFHPAGPGSIPGMGNNFFTQVRASNTFGLTSDVSLHTDHSVLPLMPNF